MTVSGIVRTLRRATSLLIGVLLAVLVQAAPAAGQTVPPDDPFLGVPILEGGASSPGGAVAVTVPHDVAKTGDGQHGVEGSSSTGNYPPALLDRLRGFDPSPFSYEAIAIYNPDGTPGTLGVATPVEGTRIDDQGNQVAGAGGRFTITPAGEFTFDPAGAFDDLQPGDRVQTSIRYRVRGTNGATPPVVEEADGVLVYTVSKAEDGTLSTEPVGADFDRYGSSDRPVTRQDVFPDLKAFVDSMLRFSFGGAPGSAVSVINDRTIAVNGDDAYGIYAHTEGAPGADGRDASLFRSSQMGATGGAGGAIDITASGTVATCVATDGVEGCDGGDRSPGVVAISVGGKGGTGGESAWGRSASSGGPGAPGANVTIRGDGTITTGGDQSSGILALSQGGDGGNGGGGSTFAGAANGAYGGAGGTVTIDGSWTITTWGSESHGIFAKSLGGTAGSGGKGGWTGTHPGSGGWGTEGGTVSVTNAGAIDTHGNASHGIYAMSVGGYGGAGGSSDSIFYAHGGSGLGAGSGGNVSVTNSTTGRIHTRGKGSHGIFAQSIGGGGGSGGSGLALVGFGGGSASGGNGGTVIVDNRGTIVTTGAASRGIYAQSIGGGGGDGGNSYGLAAIGGQGSKTSDGGNVTVVNTGSITSTADAIFAQSVGGGGGNGGSSTGWFSFGGSGGAGGNAGNVFVRSHGTLTTSEMSANAIFAQSLGGGGGNGGNSVGVGLFASVAIGGSGAAGGSGGNVAVGVDATTLEVDPVTGMLATRGSNANGILAQSIGGGGGNGGFAVSVAAGIGGAAAFALGGNAGGGNSAGTAKVYFGDASSTITTAGANANGIFAQSLGGGGGTGGFSIAAAAAKEFSASIAIGGKGGTGGSAKAVTVGSDAAPILGTITTGGTQSHGIFAQSLGGGGGSGGLAIGAGGALVGANFTMGGSGAGGGDGSTVNVTTAAAIATGAADSHAIFAQSQGGGGGAGGFSIAAGVSITGDLKVGLGGTGAGGGNANTVTLVNSGTLKTYGARSDGIHAQSVGGGGGSGGFSIATGASNVSANFAIGGNGGKGGDGKGVDVTNSGAITTVGQASHALFAQSVGGGGGSGGFGLTGSVTTTAALNFGLGGRGKTGGNAGTVDVVNTGTISTGGTNGTGGGAYGIFAQSIGGGGGAGGFGGALTVQFGSDSSGSLAFGVGGNGGGAGNSDRVNVDNAGRIETTGAGSIGIFAQSIGGGGGDGGFGLNLTMAASSGSNSSAGVSIGGGGGSGGAGADVKVTNSDRILTHGHRAQGILAQSVGGGGGNGGAAVSLVGDIGFKANTAAVTIAGSGEGGGDGKRVTVTNVGSIETKGHDSIGIHAQSIGGGGGNGGMALGATLGGPPSKGVSVAVGGSGAEGGKGGQVDLFGDPASSIVTHGDRSHAIHAQSVGGGGGNGGFSAAFTLGGGDVKNMSVALSAAVGGAGGAGNVGGTVNVGTVADAFVGRIATKGHEAVGILAQSVGGGGGYGGSSFSGAVTLTPYQSGPNLDLSLSVGGRGGSGNDGGAVVVNHAGAIDTWGDGSHGIEAQSIGGGGGDGGSSRAITLQVASPFVSAARKNFTLTGSIGGKSAGGGDGGRVDVKHVGDITTRGGDAYGIFAHSIGGGGGTGGDGHQGLPGVGDLAILPFSHASFFKGAKLVVGGSGGASGDGGAVNVDNSGSVTTWGAGATAVFAQSVGGGGGAGGNGVLGFGSALAFGVGGGTGTTGHGGRVNVRLAGRVTTWGDGAHGVFAQSVGGGGGVAGGVDRGLKNYLNIGAGLAFGQSGGGGGNGGDVRVESLADVWTRGSGSTGIFAQSVGGGGGVVGGTGNDVPLLEVMNFAGSVGGKGSGGRVDVSQSGNITTLGDAADGIFAQSAGGKAEDTGKGGKGGAVVVTLNRGDIYTLGAESNGIFAQSRGDEGGGNVTVTIADPSSIVVGGSGTGAAVRIADGAMNTITNHGTLATVSSIAGTAIVGGVGNETVHNHGIVVGSIDLGGGSNRFVNHAGASLLTGAAIRVGEGNDLVNSGTLSPGGAGVVQSTALTGNLTQSGSPRWLLDIREPGVNDRLSVSGSANFGTATTSLDFHTDAPASRAGSYRLVDAARGGLTNAAFRFGTMYGEMPVGFTFGLRQSDRTLDLTLTRSTGSFEWAGPDGGAWTAGFVDGVSSWKRRAGDFIYGTPGAASDVSFRRSGTSTMGNDFIVNSVTFGTGDYRLSDRHTLTLAGDNGLTVEGGTAALNVPIVLGHHQRWVNEGYLRVDGSAIGGSGHHLTVDGAGRTEIRAAIRTGAGSLTKAGSGVLLLSGANTYTGGTTILEGALVGNTASLQGDIVNHAQLVFDQDRDGTFAGAIGGSGWLVKENAGALWLTGDNTYSGGTVVRGGVLAGNTASLQGDIWNSAAVVFHQSAHGVYSGLIVGNGTLIKQGGSSLALSGDNWGFEGETVVESGQLFVDGILGGRSLVLRPGTLLGGNGIVTSTTLQRGAVLAPGRSVGMFRVFGDLTLDEGAVYRVETEAYGSSDAVLVSGTAAIAGAVLDVVAGGERRYRPINFYSILAAGAGVSGKFAGAAVTADYLDASVQYGAEGAQLWLRRNDVDFTSIGTRGNETAVALAFNRLVSRATGDLAAAVNTVYDLPPDEGRAAFASMSGAVYLHATRSDLDVLRMFQNASLRRLGAAGGAGGGLLADVGFAAGDVQAAAASRTTNGRGIWFGGLGDVMRYRADGSDPAATAPTRGFVAGIDTALGERIVVGLSGGQARPELSLKGTPDEAAVRAVHLGMYGRYAAGATRIDAALGFGEYDHESTRVVTDGVTPLPVASSYGGRGIQFRLEYGHGFGLGRDYSMEPIAGVELARLRLRAFEERGGSVLALAASARTVESLRFLAGARIARTWTIASGPRIVGEARAAWAHEFRGLGAMPFRFRDDPATVFTISPARPLKDTALIGLGAAGELSRHLQLFAGVDAEVGGSGEIWSGTGAIGWSW